MAFFVRWFMIICRSNMVMFQSKKMQENTIGLHHGISNYSSWFHHYFIDAPSGSLPEGTWDGSLQFVSWSSDEISEVSRDMDPQASLGWLISWNIHKWMSCESIMVSSCFDFMIHMILINDVAVRYIWKKQPDIGIHILDSPVRLIRGSWSCCRFLAENSGKWWDTTSDTTVHHSHWREFFPGFP